MTEFLDRIGRERVRSGRCLPYGEGITYYPVQLILRADAGIDIAEPRASALEKLRAAALAAFSGEPQEADGVAKRVAVLAGLERAQDALPEVAPDDLREELAWGLRRYLERRAAGSPLILVFEDVQWAEQGLLDLIEHLAEWSRAPLLLLCLARPDFRELRPAWGSAAANATAITLAPLTPDDTRRLIGELLAIDDMPETLRGEVVTRAEGNPLYVEEFLRMLIETGRIQRRDGRWVAGATIGAVEVPPTLQGLITARLDRVSSEVKRLLQRASLAGRLFSTDALTALAEGVKPDPELIRDAIRRDLLVEADERALGSGRVFRFRHVLIRDVTYSTLPKAERSRLHDRYGRWLEASLGDRRHEIADIIAFHAEQAFLLGRELGAAGWQGLGQRALDLLLEAARTAYERADKPAALNLYGRAAAAAGAIGATPAESAEIAGRAFLLREERAVERAAIAEVNDVVAVAREAGPSKVLAELLRHRSNLELQTHQNDAAAATAIDEALAVAVTVGDADLVTELMFEKAVVSYGVGDLDGMYRILLDAHEHVKRSGSNRGGPILNWLGRCAVYRGDLTSARAFAEEAIASVPYQTKFFRALAHLRRAVLAAALGDPREALEEDGRTNALMRDLGLPGRIATADWGIGQALLELGDAAAARDVLTEAVDLFERREQRGQIPEVRARLARALVMLGDVAAAREHAERARAVAAETDRESRYIAAVALGEVLEAEGDVTAADGLFRDALAILEPSGFGNALATARELYARFLIRQGRLDDAKAQLALARAFWRDPLAERHRQRIDALLAQATPVRA